MSRSGNLSMRLAALLALVALALLAPWWATLVFVAIFSVLFRYYVESILVGWLIDTTFAAELIPWITIAILVYVVVVEVLMYYISH